MYRQTDGRDGPNERTRQTGFFAYSHVFYINSRKLCGRNYEQAHGFKRGDRFVEFDEGFDAGGGGRRQRLCGRKGVGKKTAVEAGAGVKEGPGGKVRGPRRHEVVPEIGIQERVWVLNDVKYGFL
eukprot:scaffold10845_cov156-Amphora_coffeaeformis.AAC.1